MNQKKMMWNEETCELDDDDRRLNISIVIPTACTQEEEEDDGVRCSNQLSVWCSTYKYVRRRRRREVERPNQEKKKSHKIEEEEDHQVVSLSILLPHTHRAAQIHRERIAPDFGSHFLLLYS